MWHLTTADKALDPVSQSREHDKQNQLQLAIHQQAKQAFNLVYNGNLYCCTIAGDKQECVALLSIRSVTEPDGFDLKNELQANPEG